MVTGRTGTQTRLVAQFVGEVLDREDRRPVFALQAPAQVDETVIVQQELIRIHRALMTLIEVLTRLVMGGDEYAEAGRGGPVYGHQGVCMLLLRPNLFRPSADYQAGVGELVDALRAVRPAPGFAEVLAPGDPERRIRATRTRDGIPLPAEVWQSLQDTAAAVGAATP